MATTTYDDKDDHDRRLPPLPPPLPKDEGTQQAPLQASSSSPLHSYSHAAPASQDASMWAYKVVQGSLYVVGPAIEALAEMGHAHCMHHTTAAAAAAAASTSCIVRSLEPALFTRARSDRELRDGPAHHLTLLHRNEIQVEGEKGEGGGKEGGREDEADGCNKDEAAAAAAASATPTSAASPSASSPCAAEEQQTEDENEPPSLAPTLHGSLSTMPEDRDDDEAQEQGGGKGGIQDESQQTSAPAVPPPPSFSSWTRHRHQHHQDDDEEVEAVAAALLATLTTPLSTYLLPHLPPLLHDPLPLYIYRTSGEGRALAVSVLFLPGEWLRHWHGQVYRPLHVTLGFVERDERDLEARQLGRVSVLGYGLSRRRTGEVLEALVRVLPKEEEGGGEGGGLDGFLPRVRIMAGEVLRVLEMRMERGALGGWEEEEKGMEEITETLAACKRALGSMPGGAAFGVEGNEKKADTCYPSSSSLERVLQVCDGLSAMQLEPMGTKAGSNSTTTTVTGITGRHLDK